MDKAQNRIVRVDSVQNVRVIRVETTEGLGVEGDPIRRVVTFYDDDGTPLARRDDWSRGGVLAAARTVGAVFSEFKAAWDRAEGVG